MLVAGEGGGFRATPIGWAVARGSYASLSFLDSTSEVFPEELRCRLSPLDLAELGEPGTGPDEEAVAEAEVAEAEDFTETGFEGGGPPADLAAAAADRGFFFLAPRNSAGAGVGTGARRGSFLGAMVSMERLSSKG